MRFTIKHSLVFVSFALITLAACKKWDEHNKAVTPSSNETLFQEISKQQNLSRFSEYLAKTGLDKLLASSKTFTVWAPTNDALQSLDPSIVSDTAKLRAFLSNHISYQSYYTSMAQTNIRVPLLNGKREDFLNKKFGDATITEADLSAKNGVLHLIDRAVPPAESAWELVNNTTAQYKQSAFIASQNYTYQDPNLAIIDSISSATGLPVYRPGTGLVTANRFNNTVYDLKNEDKQYTFFILNDNALKTEVDSLAAFYKTGSVDSTNDLATMKVLQDVIVDSLYTIDQLPSVLISKFGVPIRINKNDIGQTIRLSNGVAYVMNKLDFVTKEKIQNIVIQGENPRGFFRPDGTPVDVRSTTFYRLRRDPNTGQLFNDISLYNHGQSELNILYQAFNLPSAKYKVYWRAVNDTISVNGAVDPIAYSQKLAMGTRTSSTFGYKSVAPNDYSEVYLGEYTQDAYGTLDIFLTAAKSTSAAANRLTLDYIRLEPEF